MLCCETGTYLAGESCRTSIAKQALNIFRWFRAFSHAVISSCGRSLQRLEGLTVWWMKFCGSILRMIRQKSDSEERFASLLSGDKDISFRTCQRTPMHARFSLFTGCRQGTMRFRKGIKIADYTCLSVYFCTNMLYNEISYWAGDEEKKRKNSIRC